MRVDYFSWIGYLSVALWAMVPVLWIMNYRSKRSNWYCYIALALAVIAWIPAKINSVTYVNRIELDESAEKAAVRERMDTRKKTAEDARGKDVAQIRFAEDGTGDFLDSGGMDSYDLKNLEKAGSVKTPDWKQARKKRSGDVKPDDSLESLVDAKGKSAAVKKDEEPALGETERKVVMMVDRDRTKANRLDALNLNLIRLLVLLGIAFVIADYMKRMNNYADSMLPLPLPAFLNEMMTPAPAVFHRPDPARRSVPEELAWITRKGETFIYITDKPDALEKIPPSLPRIGMKSCPIEVIRIMDGDTNLTDEFVFESLWYGRSSFATDSETHGGQLLIRFVELMNQRQTTNARAAKTVHIVCDMDIELDAEWQSRFEELASASGVSLMIC